MEINGRKIGPDYPPYIIAEISGNHNGDLNTAIQLIQTAKEAGCDAVKIQTFTPDSLTINTDREEFTIKSGLWAGRSLYELYTQTQTPRAWHSTLFEVAKKLDITLFSSPFSPEDVEFLEKFNPPAYKIASNEIHYVDLLRAVQKTGKPVIISMGCATEADTYIPATILNNPLYLYCVSDYPAQEFNFRTMDGWARWGFSDHSLGTMASVVAVSRGACVIEKHITLDRQSPDSKFSLLPDELEKLVIDCKSAWKLLGKVQYPGDNLPENVFTRQLWAVQDIKAGEVFTRENVRAIRAPQGMGLRADKSDDVYGYQALRDIKAHEPLTLDNVKYFKAA